MPSAVITATDDGFTKAEILHCQKKVFESRAKRRAYCVRYSLKHQNENRATVDLRVTRGGDGAYCDCGATATPGGKVVESARRGLTDVPCSIYIILWIQILPQRVTKPQVARFGTSTENGMRGLNQLDACFSRVMHGLG